MQTSKYLLAAGVLAAVILPLQVHGGPDNEEQAKLRDALRRALQQPGAPQSQPATAAKPEAAPTSTEPAPVTPPPQPAPATPVAPPPAAAAAAVAVQTPETFEPVPKADDAESIAKAREAMRQKLQELQTTPTPAPAPGTPVAAVAPAPAPKSNAAPAPAPKPAATPVATSNYTPIDAPASPFSAAKQAKLADLLARYRTDAITSQEYHAQRAAIIAQP